MIKKSEKKKERLQKKSENRTKKVTKKKRNALLITKECIGC
jgi:hypothetical protein